MKKLRILLTIVIFASISVTAFCQVKQFEKGHEAFNKGEYSNAIPFFKEYTKSVPQDGDGFRWLGYAYYYDGQYLKAVESFKTALNLPHSKNTDVVWARLAYAYDNLGHFDLAISSIKKMIELEPDSSGNFVMLSRYYMENKQYDEAITAAKRAIELKPDNSDGYILLGAVYGNKKQFDEAITALKKSIELNSKNINAYAWMGEFLIEKNSYNEAVGVYKKAIETAPAVPSLYFNLSRSYYRMGNYDEAHAAINKAIELQTIQGGIGISYNCNDIYPVVKAVIDPGPAKKADLQIGDEIREIDGKSTKGWPKEKVGLVLKGNTGSEVILTIRRSDNKIKKTLVRENIVLKEAASSIGLRSLIYRQKGNFNEAFTDAVMASSLDSSANYVQISLGAAYIDRGQYEESVKLLSRLKDNSTASLLEAIAYAKMGKTTEAINVYLLLPKDELSSKYIPLMNDLKVLLQTFKPLVKAHLDKADLFDSNKQYKEALSELSEALKIADDTERQAMLDGMFNMVRNNPSLSEVPEEARKYAIRGEMLTKDGNFEQAVMEFKKAIQIAPYNAKLYYNTSLMDGELKKYPEAISYMKIYLQADPDAPNSRALKDQIIKWEFLMEKEK